MCTRLESPDQALELTPYQQTSPGLARWEAALGAITTFREAAKLPADLAGVPFSTFAATFSANAHSTPLADFQQRRSDPARSVSAQVGTSVPHRIARAKPLPKQRPTPSDELVGEPCSPLFAPAQPNPNRAQHQAQ